jgi:hypothetical protein
VASADRRAVGGERLAEKGEHVRSPDRDALGSGGEAAVSVLGAAAEGGIDPGAAEVGPAGELLTELAARREMKSFGACTTKSGALAPLAARRRRSPSAGTSAHDIAPGAKATKARTPCPFSAARTV